MEAQNEDETLRQPKDDQHSNVTVAEGLLSLMKATREEAVKLLPVRITERTPIKDSESQFQDPEDLEANGWEVKLLHESNLEALTATEAGSLRTERIPILKHLSSVLGEDIMNFEATRWLQCTQSGEFESDGEQIEVGVTCR